MLKNLIVQVDGEVDGQGGRIKDFSPELRTSAQAEMLQQILRRIEMAINIGKGTLSDLDSVQQTATQYNGGKKAYYSIVDTLEDEIEQKYKACGAAFMHMAQAYGIAGRTKATESGELVTVKWNDEIRKDPIEQKQQAIVEVNAGIMSVAEYRMKFYGEDEATATARAQTLAAEHAQGAFVL